jgi:N12 class adenine-specific DNA methylase
MDAIIHDTMNSRQTVVYDMVESADGKEKRVINHEATVAAQARQAELKAAFENWVWADAERTERLVALYNKRYNVWRLPRFDGSHLTFPGLNTDITLRKKPAQRRMAHPANQTALMNHQVGSGKTLTAIVAAMEARRLGLARKVMAVVPNQVIGQWEAETIRAYPTARVLTVLAGDLGKTKRGTFLSRIATGDWDLVLVPYSVFTCSP